MQVGSLQEQVGQLTEKLESANQKTSETVEQVETLRQQLTNDASDAAAENQDLQVCTLFLIEQFTQVCYLMVYTAFLLNFRISWRWQKIVNKTAKNQ